MEIFAFFNRPKNQQKCRQYYPVTIPLQVSRNGQTVSSLDASWLEHMSDHFRKGGVLVNAVFHLGMANGTECLTTLLFCDLGSFHPESCTANEPTAFDS